MGYKTVTVTVDADVYIDDVINEMDDQELIDELEGRGYNVTKNVAEQEGFDRFDWQFILELIDRQRPDWELRRLREKVIGARFG
jgi:hypothetical protein